MSKGWIPLPVLRGIVRSTVRPVLGPNLEPSKQRKILDAESKIGFLPNGTKISSTTVGGVPADLVTTPGADSSTAVLYIHGGGYTVGSPITHRALVAYLADSAKAPVYAVDYRLAPESPYPAALDDCLSAYGALLDKGVSPGQIAVAGDSAGGGLTLALAITLRDKGLPLPSALGLISPWVDVTLANVHDDRRDPLLRTSWLRSCAKHYGVGADLSLPTISPINADLLGLPPTIVQAGGREIFKPDVERFVARLEEAGVAVKYHLWEDLWHVAHLQAGMSKQPTQATREIGEFFSSQFTR